MWEYYLLSFGGIFLCAIIGLWANGQINSAYKKYGAMPAKSGMTGYEVARKILRVNGINDIEIGKIRGTLTDHYHPTKGIVNLSESVFSDASIASCAVSAHEIGHVLQNKKGYFPYKVRGALVAVTNIGSRLAFPLVLVGLLLDFVIVGTKNADLGYWLALVGVGLYGLSTLFALATLPVELNASKRARIALEETGILTEEEIPYARKMLNSAAMTYVASLLTSLIYFLRFALWVLLLFGGRRRRR